ncbi:MAG: SUMF1/EgtB/PvdO family nonheme iron enzyme [Chloroflexota bacterium]
MFESEQHSSRHKVSSFFNSKKRRRAYSPPELEWDVGDEQQLDQSPDIPDSFTLIPRVNTPSNFAVTHTSKSSSDKEQDDSFYSSRYKLTTLPANSDSSQKGREDEQSHFSSASDKRGKGSISYSPPAQISSDAPDIAIPDNGDAVDSDKFVAESAIDDIDDTVTLGAEEQDDVDYSIYTRRDSTQFESTAPTTDSLETASVNPFDQDGLVKDSKFGEYVRRPLDFDQFGNDAGAIDADIVINKETKKVEDPKDGYTLVNESPLDEVDSKSQLSEATRRRLDKALEEWWQQSQLPTAALLRDSLLLLEEGESLDDVHLSLLLRTALSRHRGMLTALRHQRDPDRSAFLLKEALIDVHQPFTSADVAWLAAEDEKSAEWSELLLDDLHVDQPSLTGKARQAVDEVIQLLEGQDTSLAIWEPGAIVPMSEQLSTTLSRPLYWNVGRMILALLFVLLFVSSWQWLQARSLLPDMVHVAQGTYVVGNEDLGIPEKELFLAAGFTIDRTEVTNRSYQACYEQGACLAPVLPNSANRAAYFLHRDYTQFPVVHVDWVRANQYCTWAKKRLPTADEWEVAASAAPATNQRFLYPWGNHFNPLYTNSSQSQIQDTQTVGLSHPGGTSTIGVMDMAGNVAEWTATERTVDSIESYIVKGGSYKDTPEMLLASNIQLKETNFSASWLGFRCASTVPQGAPTE